MRADPKQTAQFKRDLKAQARGRYRGRLEDALMPVLTDLGSDVPLAPRYRDHALIGGRKAFRDCHIKPDLVLLYQKPDEETLILLRLGSHSDLGL